ncbi:MAG: thiamine-phosphate kinase [Crocinitomicaceae bacterium]
MSNRTELDKLGEFGLIDHITKNFVNDQPTTVKGIGDDAAVIDSGDKYSLISTDMLVEGVHFNLMYTPLKHLGYKAVMVNLSDIYAMNGDATQITVSIAISNRFSVEAVEELYSGIKTACELYKVDLIGGDTTSSTSGLIISITALGEVKKDEIAYRSGASENDLLVVSGDLGGAFMGLQVLEREKEVYKDNPEMQPELEGFDYILERQLKPESRKDVIHFLKDLGVKPTSMIDVSDGLASEVLHLSKASGLGATIYEDKLPIDQETFDTARSFNLVPSTCALNGGEDYELLFTIKQSDFEKIKANSHFSIIGHFTDKSSAVQIVEKGGTVQELKAQGWQHFNKG